MAAPMGYSHHSPAVAGSESLQHIPHGLESKMTQVVKKGFNKKLEQTAVIRAESDKCHLHTTSLFTLLLLSPSSNHALVSFAQCHIPSQISQFLTFFLLPPSYQLQTPGLSSPKLCLLGAPSIGDWRFLVFGIISCLPGLCLYVLLFIPSPFAQERSLIG